MKFSEPQVGIEPTTARKSKHSLWPSSSNSSDAREVATFCPEQGAKWPRAFAIKRNTSSLATHYAHAGTSMDPELDGETMPPAPLPRDPDSFDLFGDEPTEPPESIPSPAEGEEAAPAGGALWSGDPSRVVFGQVVA